MNKIIMNTVKLTVTAAALAAALTGCCMFGSNDCCGKKGCHCAESAKCRCTKEGCRPECGGAKKHGVNTSMTLGVGTDGIRVGSDANVGSHGASMHANADAGAGGIAAGAEGSVH